MTESRIQPASWSVADAMELYGVSKWSQGFFGVSGEGEMVVNLESDGQRKQVSLSQMVEGLQERGLELPVLLRFGDILAARLAEINETFCSVIEETGYQAPYRGVYPIKVNQQEQVVEEIVRYGQRYHFGLEAGSKAELIATLALMDDPEAYLVCNGYKDAEFIDLALYGLKMGISTILVVEMPGELQLILERAEALGIDPQIGVRVKLSAKSSGYWNDSGGDHSAFGLTVAQVMDVVDELRVRDKLHCLRMLHYHQGSQVPNIQSIRQAAIEACRIYVDLVREGAPLGILDVGGGLAVDYDGSHTNSAVSSNYGTREYCADLIEAIMKVTDDADVPHPTIISESGRALVAYHSVLVFNILHTSQFEPPPLEELLPPGSHELVANLFEIYEALRPDNFQESFNDARYYRDEMRTLFMFGQISLRQRAYGEQIFWHIATRIGAALTQGEEVPEALQKLESQLVDIYYGNFSVFQSLPDIWAIDQLFPVVPLRRLEERPLRKAILSDITCDCDGKIDRFIDSGKAKKYLPVHALREGEDYALGVFLVGAYQETLGDLHNLLGDTHVVGVRLEEGRLRFDREIEGDTVGDVLSYVEYEPKDLLRRFRQRAEQAVDEGKIVARERRVIMGVYENGLRGYTYHESEEE